MRVIRRQINNLLTALFGSRVRDALANLYYGKVVAAVQAGQVAYETRVAPHFAANFGWVFWPIFQILRFFHLCFVANTADGTGHIMAELDSFLRQRYLRQIDPGKRYVWIRPANNPYAPPCATFYRQHFSIAIANTLLYYLLLPMIMRYVDITIDAGLSRLKWQLPTRHAEIASSTPLPGQRYVYQVKKHVGNAQWTAYYKRRSLSCGYYPLAEGNFKSDRQLRGLLGGTSQKLALIQIKDRVLNASARPTDPGSYLDTLAYLIELGYTLVFVGRERIPNEFTKLNMINYANSDIATFERDILLFRLSVVAIVGGSGVSFLADAMGKPYLYLNSWHLPMQMPSERCICVPTLVRRRSGALIKFAEQIKLYNELPDVGAEVFPAAEYEARNATSDEILAAAQELIALMETQTARSSLQERFRQHLDPNIPLFWAPSRVSQYFLEKHLDLF